MRKQMGVVKLKGRGDYLTDDQRRSHDAQVAAQLKSLQDRVSKMSSSGAQSEVGKVAGKLGKIAGGLLGQGDLGQMAGEGLARLFGYGDYQLVENSIIGPVNNKSTAIPVFSKDGRRGVRVTEREYIGDVTGSVLFSNASYPINPASPLTFPWLSAIAAQYDEWEPLGIVFEFVSTSTEYSTTVNLGSVIMATDYNVLDQPFSSKLQMEESEFACSTKPSNSLMHGIECAPAERPNKLLFTRNGSIPSTGTLQYYDLGNFQIATQGMPSSAIVGELWVSYDIAFYKKQLFASFLGNGIMYFQGIYKNPTTASPYGTPDTADYPSPVNSNFAVVVSGNTIVFPKNFRNVSFQVLFNFAATNVVAGTPLLSGSNGIKTATSGTAPWISSTGITTSLTGFDLWTISDQFAGYGSGNPTITVNCTLTSGTFTTLILSQVPYVPNGNLTSYVIG